MTAEHLFESIGLVDDRLVEEAADARGSSGHWKNWAALAACLALVVGIGSVSMSLMFRGCGAKSAAPESADTSNSAGMGWDDITQDTAPAETPADDAPADMPADEPMAEPGPAQDPGESPEGDTTDGAQPLPLTADQAGLSFRRETRTEPVDDEMQRVVDAYWVANETGGDLEVTFHYTADADPKTLELQVAGQPVSEPELESADGGSLIGTFPATIGVGETVEITATYLQPTDG